MRGLHVFLFVFLGVMIASLVIAHPGNLDFEYCHRCSFDCDIWDVSLNARHCHPNGDYSITTDPSYNNPEPIDYDFGIIALEEGDCGRCPDAQNQYCGSDDKCHCHETYIRDAATTQCVNKDHFCQAEHGRYSLWSDVIDGCGCKKGYLKNADYDKCTPVDEICRDTYGKFIDGNLDGSCKCRQGYSFTPEADRCITTAEPLKEIHPDVREGAEITGERIRRLLAKSQRERISTALRKYFETHDNARGELARYLRQVIQTDINADEA